MEEILRRAAEIQNLLDSTPVTDRAALAGLEALASKIKGKVFEAHSGTEQKPQIDEATGDAAATSESYHHEPKSNEGDERLGTIRKTRAVIEEDTIDAQPVPLASSSQVRKRRAPVKKKTVTQSKKPLKKKTTKPKTKPASKRKSKPLKVKVRETVQQEATSWMEMSEEEEANEEEEISKLKFCHSDFDPVYRATRPREEDINREPEEPIVCKLCEVNFKERMRNTTASGGDNVQYNDDSYMYSDQVEYFPTLPKLRDHLKEAHVMELSGDEPPSLIDSQEGAGLDMTVDIGAENNTEADPELKSELEKLGLVKKKDTCLHCVRCGKMYVMKQNNILSMYSRIVFHMYKIHNEVLPPHIKVLKCDDCSYETLSGKYLRQHHQVHDVTKSCHAPCEVCGKLLRKMNISLHMATVHGSNNVSEAVKNRIEMLPCPECGKSVRGTAGLARHLKFVHRREREHMCDMCSSCFCSERDLTYHLFSYHNKINRNNLPVYRCELEGCEYETLCARYLTIHNLSHSDVRPHICEKCGKSFKTKSSLVQHHRIMHDKDTLYHCELCKFTTHAIHNLKRHQVIHSAHKKHRCKIPGCDYATHFRENLAKHMKKKNHDAKPLENKLDPPASALFNPSSANNLSMPFELPTQAAYTMMYPPHSQANEEKQYYNMESSSDQRRQ